MDRYGWIACAATCSVAALVGGIQIMAAAPADVFYLTLGFVFAVIGAAGLVLSAVAFLIERRIRTADLENAFVQERPDGSIVRVTNTDISRMPRAELQIRLRDPNFDRWYRRRMYARVGPTVMFYNTLHGRLLLSAKLFGPWALRRIRRLIGR